MCVKFNSLFDSEMKEGINIKTSAILVHIVGCKVE